MKIGFLTTFDKEMIEFAKRGGFGSIELLISPGNPLDPLREHKDAVKRAKEYIQHQKIEISAVGTYDVNCLHPDKTKRTENVNFIIDLMKICKTLEVDILATYPGRDPEKGIEENIPSFKEVFAPLAKKAEDEGLKIAFENCPKFHYFPFRGFNIAYCPQAWDLMFDAVDSESLGLEYDPSHPASMFADCIEPIYKYGEKIFHVHAKDTEIVQRNLRINGIFGPGMFRYRIPGFGVIDWKKFVSALREVGYEGNLDIEGGHDSVFSREGEKRGLLSAQRFLSQFIP